MYSYFFQTSQYIIPYHNALQAGNGQKDRFSGDISKLSPPHPCLLLFLR